MFGKAHEMAMLPPETTSPTRLFPPGKPGFRPNHGAESPTASRLDMNLSAASSVNPKNRLRQHG
jgi:hypothetical protein